MFLRASNKQTDKIAGDFIRKRYLWLLKETENGKMDRKQPQTLG